MAILAGTILVLQTAAVVEWVLVAAVVALVVAVVTLAAATMETAVVEVAAAMAAVAATTEVAAATAPEIEPVVNFCSTAYSDGDRNQ
eukprot:3048000-Pleurochrysis_carterae.AAC.3